MYREREREKKEKPSWSPVISSKAANDFVSAQTTYCLRAPDQEQEPEHEG